MRQKISAIAPFGLRMPSEIKDWISAEAERQERSMNFVILRILEIARTAAAEGQIGVGSSAAAPNNNAALASGAPITNG